MAAKIRVQITETATSVSANTSTITIKVQYYGNGVSYNGYSPSGSVTVNGTKYSFSHSFTKSQSWQTLYTKTGVKITHNADGSKTISYSAKFATDVSLGTLTTSGSKTLTKFTRQFTVSYNANGGSGAPASQTKTYGTALTLSSTKPTRTGYTFKGWATSASGSVAYSSGGSYTANSAVTLYAVWSANQYTVSFVSSNPSAPTISLTATYNSSFAFPSEPAIEGYAFQGWATTSGGSVAYTPGQTITWTTTSNKTYYAVWKKLFTPAVVTSKAAIRVDEDGNPNQDGVYAYFGLNWANGDAIATKVRLEYTDDDGHLRYYEWTTQSAPEALRRGSVEIVDTSGSFTTSKAYEITWLIYDPNFETPIKITDIISKSSFLWKGIDSTFLVGKPLFLLMSVSNVNPTTHIAGGGEDEDLWNAIVRAGWYDAVLSSGNLDVKALLKSQFGV